MLNIHIWALAAIIIVSVLAFDAIGSGVLYIIHGQRSAGLRWMSGGLAGTSVAALLLRVDASIPLAAVIIPAAASAALLVLDRAYRRAGIAKEREAARKASDEEFSEKVMEGVTWVGRIIDLLMMTRSTVHFDRRSYDSGLDKTEMPWCRRWDSFIDGVRISEYNPAAIVITVHDQEGNPIESQFDGTENEDYEHLFYDIFDEVWEPDEDCEEDYGADEWLNQRKAICSRAETSIRIILQMTGSVAASYIYCQRMLNVVVPEGTLGEGKDGTPRLKALFRLFRDAGYYRVRYETFTGPYEASGMLSGGTDLHPDIREDVNPETGEENIHETEAPEWLKKVVEYCDAANWRPTSIRFSEYIA